jgi:hypothetical protein
MDEESKRLLAFIQRDLGINFDEMSKMDPDEFLKILNEKLTRALDKMKKDN